MKDISIVIVDDHAMVRQGIRALLESEPHLKVVAEASSGLEAIDVVNDHRPDVLLLDLILPGLDGLEVARISHRRCPDTKVIILTMHSNEAYVFKALQAGVRGYVLKSCGSEELLRAIEATMQGEVYLSSPLSKERINQFANQTNRGEVDLYDTLTKREKQVMQLATQGLTNVRMAGQLGISPRTIEVHRANLMRKLKVNNHSELLRFSLSRGLFPTDDLPPSRSPGN